MRVFFSSSSFLELSGKISNLCIFCTINVYLLVFVLLSGIWSQRCKVCIYVNFWIRVWLRRYMLSNYVCFGASAYVCICHWIFLSVYKCARVRVSPSVLDSILSFKLKHRRTYTHTHNFFIVVQIPSVHIWIEARTTRIYS